MAVEIKEEKVSKKQVKECKVFYFTETQVAFDFDGYGIMADYKGEHKDFIKVEYTGTIGKPDFKFEVK